MVMITLSLFPPRFVFLPVIITFLAGPLMTSSVLVLHSNSTLLPPSIPTAAIQAAECCKRLCMSNYGNFL